MTVATVSPETIAAAADMVAPADAGADTRHARALAALRSAEERTGVRKQATAARAVQTVPAPAARAVETVPGQAAVPLSGHAPSELSRGQSHGQPRAQVRALRGGLSTGSGGGLATGTAASAGGLAVGQPGEGARVLPVHPHLAALLPDGGLRTGTTVVVRGSTSLLLTLLAEASRDGAWTVLVGYPAAGMAAAADAGCDLTRTLVVPLPAGSGVDAPAVLAALIDGMDVVVVGPEVALLDQDRRRLTARARDRGTVLMAALPGWDGAHVVLEATEGTWAGMDDGAGWLRRRTLRVRRTGRGNASRPLHLDVEVPVCRAADGGAERVGGEGSVVGEAGVLDGDAGRRHGPEGRPRLGLVG